MEISRILREGEFTIELSQVIVLIKFAQKKINN